MTRADQIRQMDDVDLAGWICENQPSCKRCKFLKEGHCTVVEYVEEEVEDE